MRAFRTAQVVRKRMRTTRDEVKSSAFVSEPSRHLEVLREGRIVAAFNLDAEARRRLIPSHAKLPPGRPNLWYTLAPELGYLIGVDFSHQEVSVSMTRANFGKLLEEVRRRPIEGLDDQPKHALDVAAEMIREVVAEVRAREKFTAADIIGIGVGVPGPVDRKSRTIAPEMHVLSPWAKHQPTVELAERLKKFLPHISVEIENDASLGALGVYSWKTLAATHNKVPRDLLYVRVGDGIGAGVVIKGKLVGGGSGIAGEIGHVKVDDHGRFCNRCGQKGCVETKSSEEAVLADLGPVVGLDAGGGLTIDAVVASGHPACFRSLNEAGWYLGTALAHARTLLDPARIYIGGAMAHSQHFMKAVREGILRNSINLASNLDEVIVPAPRGLPRERPDLRSPELFGAIAMALHRCGDAHIERRLRDHLARQAAAERTRKRRDTARSVKKPPG